MSDLHSDFHRDFHPVDPADRIIVPLDVPTEAAAMDLLDRLPEVRFWKVGLELFVATGASLLQTLKQRDKQIFLDLKFHDIPNTVAGACASAARYGVDLLTVHAVNGSIALARAQEAAATAAATAGVQPPKIIAVTLLTSISPDQLAGELQVPTPVPDFTRSMAKLAKTSGLAGAVCSPQEAQDLRQACGSNFILVCPGVRPAGSAVGDQQRVMTPKAAIAAGASYLVIGRPITAATDPQAMFNQILNEIS
jgi:orotidine-5'-phosphate decarboxylase